MPSYINTTEEQKEELSQFQEIFPFLSNEPTLAHHRAHQSCQVRHEKIIIETGQND